MKHPLSMLVVAVVVLLFVDYGAALSQFDSNPILPNRWETIAPGGETICARGADYSFYHRAGSSDKLMIYFQGGGACWDSETCAPGYSPGDPDDEFDDFDIFSAEVRPSGVQSLEDTLLNADISGNSTADHSVVYVTYCTGDVHTGDITHEYSHDGQDYTLHHRGATNTNAALNWAFEQYPNPEQVFVVGCSAGSYASIYHAPTIIERYTDVPVVQLGEAGSGSLIPPGWRGYASWNYRANMPNAARAIPLDEYIIPSLYTEVASAYPSATFAQYSAFGDGVQMFYGAFISEMTVENERDALGLFWRWTRETTNGFELIDRETDNFAYFVEGALGHCTLDGFQGQQFDQRQANGVSYIDWIADLLNGDVESVRCQADECYAFLQDLPDFENENAE